MLAVEHMGRPTSFWSVPVKYEPGGIHGSDDPAVCTEHVHEQYCAGNTWREGRVSGMNISVTMAVGDLCHIENTTFEAVDDLPFAGNAILRK